MGDVPASLLFILPRAAPPAGIGPQSIGAKAYGLMRLNQLALPVPPAFVLGTAYCREYFARGGHLPDDARTVLSAGLARLEEATGRSFGNARRPLLVSVRSGAPVSMPGMMETVLNVGLNRGNLAGLLRTTGNPRQVHDCYRRLLKGFMEVVHGAAAGPFDAILERHCASQGLASPRELDSRTLAEIARETHDLAAAIGPQPIPQDPMEQLVATVEAVIRSWNSEKARHYRRLNGIDDALGTAVMVQAMVYGNSGASSGAGVGFTRDPSTGEAELYLDFEFNAQGEDVVSGRHNANDAARLVRELPRVVAELKRIKTVLETEFHDMQDFEFTLEQGRLYLLQTRVGKRTPWAALRIAVDLVREGLIAPGEALAHLEGVPLEHIGRARLLSESAAPPLASGIPASIGVACGALVFDSRRAAELAAAGRHVILARPDVHTDDIEGIAAADGILTARGGRTSHAAVVARQLGKVCVVGCEALRIAADGADCQIGQQHVTAGEEITLDGESGRIYAGRLGVVTERPERELAVLESWRRD